MRLYSEGEALWMHLLWQESPLAQFFGERGGFQMSGKTCLECRRDCHVTYQCTNTPPPASTPSWMKSLLRGKCWRMFTSSESSTLITRCLISLGKSSQSEKGRTDTMWVTQAFLNTSSCWRAYSLDLVSRINRLNFALQPACFDKGKGRVRGRMGKRHTLQYTD